MHRFVRSIIAAGAFVLACGFTSIPWKSTRKEIVLPDESITRACVHIPQSQIELFIPPANYMLGVGAIATHAIMENSAQQRGSPLLGRLNRDIPKEHVGEVMLNQVRAGAWRRHFPALQRIDACPQTAQDHPKTVNASERLMSLTLRYHFAQNMGALLVEMEAEIGSRSELVSNIQGSSGKPAPYSQTLYYDIPVTGQGRLVNSAEGAAFWRNIDSPTISRGIEAGIGELVAMLDYELDHAPSKGRQSGKQIALRGSYGVEVHRTTSRQWVRLRNGRIASIPLAPAR